MARQAITVYLKEAIESGFTFVKRRFKTIKELNENFKKQRTWIYEQLEKKSDYKRRLARVLEIIKKHACKHLGIFYMTENHLCEAYEAQFKESISKRTISTCIKHLRELQFVSVVPTKRADGKQSANILVLERLEGADEQEASKAPSTPGAKGKSTQKVAHKEAENLHTKKTLPSFKTLAKARKERKANKRLLNLVPKWFQETISCCAREAKAVHEYWRVAKHLMRKVFADRIGQEDVPEIVRAATKEFFKACKAATKGKFDMVNPFGFYHTVLEAEASAHLRRQAQETNPLFYNWLED